MGSVSVTLSPPLSDLASAAAAREHLPVEQLVEVAVSRYLQAREALEETLRDGHTYGHAIGIRSEEDVYLVADGIVTLEHLQRRNSL